MTYNNQRLFRKACSPHSHTKCDPSIDMLVSGLPAPPSCDGSGGSGGSGGGGTHTHNYSTTGTAFWTNDGTRAGIVPLFIGQLGVQTDTGRVYISTGLAAGNWQATSAEYIVVHNRTEFDAANAIDDASILVIGNITVDADLTVNSDKRVAVTRLGKFTISTGKLTFHATPDGWGEDQWVFHGNGVAFTPLPRKRATADGTIGGVAGDVEGAFGDVPRRPEWFGAVRDSATFDCTDAIVSACKASKAWTPITYNGPTYWVCQPVDVKLAAANYYHARTIDVMGCNLKVTGCLRGGTRITAFTTFDFANSVPEVCDFPQSNWIDFTPDFNTDTCEAIGHGMSDGDMVWVHTTGAALPFGLTRGTNMWLHTTTRDTFKLSSTPGTVTPIPFTDDGTLSATKNAIVKIGKHQVRRKSIVYGQLLFGGPVGVNTAGLAQTRDGGAFGNHFQYIYFVFTNRQGYNTAQLFAPNYIQENNTFQNLIFYGSNFCQMLFGARDRTQLDWFDCNGVRIEQCEFGFTTSQGLAGTGFTTGSVVRVVAGRFVDISNNTFISRSVGAVASGSFTTTALSDIITTPVAHNLQNGDAIYFPDVGTLTEIEAFVSYYIIDKTPTTFRLTTTMHDTADAIGAFATATSGSWLQSNACITAIDSKSISLTVRSTHCEAGVVGILVDSGGIGLTNDASASPAPAGPLVFWNATRPPQYVSIDVVDFNVKITEAALKITRTAELASVHVNNLSAIYNIGLDITKPVILLDDVPRGRKSHGIGSPYLRSIVQYVRGYAKEVASPDGVKVGNYVSTLHPELMEAPPFLDPELFIGQPYVEIGGAVKMSLGRNPALLTSIIDSFPFGGVGHDAAANWEDETGNLKTFTTVGTVTDVTSGVGDPANTGDFVSSLNHLNHLVGAVPADYDYGSGNATFSFTVWVRFNTLSAVSGTNNTVISKTGSGSVASTAFTGLGPDFVSAGHPFQDGNVVYLSAISGTPGIDAYDLLELDEPYVVLGSTPGTFQLARYDAPTSPITCGIGIGATAVVTGGFELIWIPNVDPLLSEIRLIFPHPSAEYNSYHANPTVDPVQGEWTLYYGAWDKDRKEITLRNVTADSEVTRIAHDVDFDVTGGTFEDFVPLYDPNIPLRIGDRTNDANSGGDCNVEELVFYNRTLTKDECRWIHNWRNGRAFSEHA